MLQRLWGNMRLATGRYFVLNTKLTRKTPSSPYGRRELGEGFQASVACIEGRQQSRPRLSGY